MKTIKMYDLYTKPTARILARISRKVKIELSTGKKSSLTKKITSAHTKAEWPNLKSRSISTRWCWWVYNFHFPPKCKSPCFIQGDLLRKSDNENYHSSISIYLFSGISLFGSFLGTSILKIPFLNDAFISSFFTSSPT